MSEQWHGGKGGKYRPTNSDKMTEFWKRYCDNHGHRYVNRRCIYCGEFKHEANDCMAGEEDSRC